MNYSDLPRELIFENRRSLDDFSVDETESPNSLFFNQLMQINCLSPEYLETEKQILSIFNDAYYIVTLIYLEKRPVLRLGYYRQVARYWPDHGVEPQREAIVLAMINEMLGLIREELPYQIITFKEKLEHFLSTNHPDANLFFIVANELGTYSENEFLPREITSEVADKIDWVKLTENFNLETIKDLFDNLGQNANEKKVLIKAIYDAEDATGNLSQIPYAVDGLLDELYRKCDENNNGLISSYDPRRETLNIDKLMQDVEVRDEITSLQKEVNQLAGEKDTLEKEVLSLCVEKDNAMKQIQESHDEIENLRKERDDYKNKYEELSKEPEKAFNALTGLPCFTNRQMGILMTAVGNITETPPPGKTTLGNIIERITGYKATTASGNMKGAIPYADTKVVADAIEEKFPNLAAEVKKL